MRGAVSIALAFFWFRDKNYLYLNGKKACEQVCRITSDFEAILLADIFGVSQRVENFLGVIPLIQG